MTNDSCIPLLLLLGQGLVKILKCPYDEVIKAIVLNFKEGHVTIIPSYLIPLVGPCVYFSKITLLLLCPSKTVYVSEWLVSLMTQFM